MAPHMVEGTKVLSWGSELIEDGAMEQANRTARLPFVHGHLALMPDAHFGSGATIGSVIPTKGAIVPAAVGVDIGCGMNATQLDLRVDQLPDNLDDFHGHVTQFVPATTGQAHTYSVALWDRFVADRPQTDTLTESQKLPAKARNQFGSLGGGNHFVELSYDADDNVWIVLHSGSRGVGYALAERHIKTAKKLMQRYFIGLEDPDLAYLVQGTPEFKAYIDDMHWAQDYAAANRQAMMEVAIECLLMACESQELKNLHWRNQFKKTEISCHHNYTQQENHGGENLWVTRKGAIRAREGDLGIIPGSMGTSTFIVEGLGNESSYCSAAHGSGRVMSRGKARAAFTASDMDAAMAHVKSWNKEDARSIRDEIPAAYKDITQVMAAQADLVRPIAELKQIVSYKGK